MVLILCRNASGTELMNLIDPNWIVLAAGGAFIIGYLIINQVMLRLMVALGTFLYIWYYAVAIEDPWAAVLTSVLMGLANLVGLAQIWYRNSSFVIPKVHRDIYRHFSTLPPGDYRALMKLSERLTTSENLLLTKEGSPVDRLYFVLDGEMRAQKLGKSFSVPSGLFVGEVAYMTEQPASASVMLSKGSKVIQWDIAQLKAKARKNPRFRLAVDALISADLARKVTDAIRVDAMS